MPQIDFVNREGVVEHRLKMDGDSEYMILDHTMLGEYTVEVSGSCRVLHDGGFDEVLENSNVDVELVSGKLILVASPRVELPTWASIYREFRTGA